MFPFMKGDTAKPRGFLFVMLKILSPQQAEQASDGSFQKGAQKIFRMTNKAEIK